MQAEKIYKRDRWSKKKAGEGDAGGIYFCTELALEGISERLKKDCAQGKKYPGQNLVSLMELSD